MNKQALVFDTNVLISAFILPKSTARKALDKALDIGRIVFSKSTVDEFAEVMLRSKFDKYAPLPDRLDALNQLVDLADIISPRFTITASRDEKDDQFLELAVAANATYIVSGDQDLLILNPFRNIPILTAADFLKEF